MNQLIEAWLDVHHKLVHLLSPSSLKVKSDGSRAKNISTDRSVADEDHVCQTCRDHGGQNCDIHLTFPGVRLLQCGYQVSPRDVTTEALHHDYQASLHFTVVGNYLIHIYIIYAVGPVKGAPSHQRRQKGIQRT